MKSINDYISEFARKGIRKALVFDTRKDFLEYKSRHRIRKDTKVTIKDEDSPKHVEEETWKRNTALDTNAVQEGDSIFRKDSKTPFFRTKTLSKEEKANWKDSIDGCNDMLRRIGCGISVLGARISRDFQNFGKTDILEKKVSSPEDLAAISQIYRNPNFETFHFILVKDGKVVYHTGISSRLPACAVALLPSGYVKTFDRFLDTARRLKAEGFYLLHNHPSGNVDASFEDIATTRHYAKNFKINDGFPFLGHVIVNHSRFGLISEKEDGDFGYEVRDLKNADGLPNQYEVGKNPVKEHELLGKVIKSNNDVALMSKSLARNGICLVGTDVKLTVNAIAGIEESMLSGYNGSRIEKVKLLAALRKLGITYGVRNLFLTNVPLKYTELMAEAIRSGIVMDAVMDNGTSVARMIDKKSRGSNWADNNGYRFRTNEVKYEN